MYWNVLSPIDHFIKERWIVTLDVLKYNFNDNLFFNARLNSNIRCIEMCICYPYAYKNIGWIVTLDVLKSYPETDFELVMRVE